MAWLVVLPLVAGAAIWGLGPREGRRARIVLAVASAAALIATCALAVVAGATAASTSWAWGAGLRLGLEVPPLAAAVAITVPGVALATVVYAAAHEAACGLARQLGLLVVFTGAMELVVVAADLLTVLIGWELVAAVSWALIGHQWRDPTRPARAAHAFNVTRAGALGLFVAAGAAFAATGGLTYTDLAAVDGPALHLVAAGVVVAAVTKSAQLPFSPWLFSAMAGPTPVSALLHSATMVAAGAYLLVRLQPVLGPVGWFGPVTLTIGLLTALAGGVVAVVQHRAKHLLAASTSAQYGLMLVAVGAGYPVVATAHLVAHAAFKALLFLAAGVAISAVGSEVLGRMRLGSHRPATAVLAAAGSLALAAVPPLGAAWSKEQIVAAATAAHLLAGIVAIVAGGLSALYITRFQLLAFGPRRHDDTSPRDRRTRPGRVELGAMAGLALATIGLSALWLPPVEHMLRRIGQLPSSEPWELVASLSVVAAAAYAAVLGDRAGWLASLGTTGASRRVGQWLGLSELSRRAIADPVLQLAAGTRRFDDRVVDAGVRGVARLASATATRAGDADVRVVDAGVRGVAALTRVVAERWTRLTELGVDGAVRGVAGGFSWSARDLRRLQTGAAHHYLTIVTVGAALAVAVAALWR
ncbi:MAG: NADH-quinone oxidoreductase subunit L [Actinobacteria bacterium]|nr:NADH-quinone oxidoreductase subunit L [Actinomycetota bacterium]